MNNCLKGTVCLLLTTMITPPSLVSAEEHSLLDIAHLHYRCSALVELNRMTDADRIVCDELGADGFDLTAWETANRDASIKLHEEVFGEFF